MKNHSRTIGYVCRMAIFVNNVKVHQFLVLFLYGTIYFLKLSVMRSDKYARTQY